MPKSKKVKTIHVKWPGTQFEDEIPFDICKKTKDGQQISHPTIISPGAKKTIIANANLFKTKHSFVTLYYGKKNDPTNALYHGYLLVSCKPLWAIWLDSKGTIDEGKCKIIWK